MTAAITKSKERTAEKTTSGRGRGRPPTYATKEAKMAAFRTRKHAAGLMLAWVPKALIEAYRADVAAWGAL